MRGARGTHISNPTTCCSAPAASCHAACSTTPPSRLTSNTANVRSAGRGGNSRRIREIWPVPATHESIQPPANGYAIISKRAALSPANEVGAAWTALPVVNVEVTVRCPLESLNVSVYCVFASTRAGRASVQNVASAVRVGTAATTAAASATRTSTSVPDGAPGSSRGRDRCASRGTARGGDSRCRCG